MKRTEPECSPGFDPFRLSQTLFDHYGPSGWWPGDSPCEVAIGAILTQNTAWTNVEKAMANLKAASLIDVRRLHGVDGERLAALIRPAGYYNIKARRLKNFVQAVMEASSGDLDRYFDTDMETLRSALLMVNGIGRETADSIGCYAAGKLVFVVDAYTRRILLRHGLIEEDASYDHIRRLFEAGLPPEISVYKDLHAHLVLVGKEFCRPKSPRCCECPLRDLS